MNCPVCNNVTLLMSEKQWIEIDYCPQCRGVWLDRWELEKIIERSWNQWQPQVSNYNQQPQQHSNNHYNAHDQYHSKHKKESFLWELFDF